MFDICYTETLEHMYCTILKLSVNTFGLLSIKLG